MASNPTYQTTGLKVEGISGTFARHWWAIFCLVYGIFISLPFLAPVFMHWGWESPARMIYFIYSFLCHQLPERSLFLFGPKVMVPLGDIQAVWKNTIDPFVLRQFIGASQMGWKVAWSDRMVAMYTSVFVFGLLWRPFRRWIRPLPWWGFLLLLLPMAIDGTSHFISDLWGLEQGFRQTNLWLVALTHNSLPVSFYVGNALGSFNSYMRWLSGIFFGLGVVWLSFPYADQVFQKAENF